jgi:hypothetical protein
LACGILLGNAASGALLSAAHRWKADEITWGGVILIGLMARQACCRAVPA